MVSVLKFVSIPVALLAASRLWAGQVSASGAIEFNRDIRPIISENCFACHGPDPAARKKGLRLDREDGLFRKTENGIAVVRGKPAESDLYQRITTDDEDELMPPPKSHKKLTAQPKE